MTTPRATPRAAVPDRYVRLIDDLRPFRPVAAQLLRLIGDPTLSLNQMTPLLRSDPVIAAEVLRLANSPLFGCRRQVKSILHALALLGVERVNMVVLTVAMRGLAGTQHDSFTHQLWRHSLATALFCEMFAQPAGLTSETCYVAGLIHDIGHFALARVAPNYAREVPLAIGRGMAILAAERDFCAIDHCEAGRRLLSQWGFPLDLQNVAARHEGPVDANTLDGPMVALVGASSRLADAMGMTVFPCSPRPESPDVLPTLAGLAGPTSARDFPDIAEAVVARLNAIELSLF